MPDSTEGSYSPNRKRKKTVEYDTEKSEELDESKEMTNWNHLPFEMKEMVIKEMDIVTRAKLKQCSKTDKYLVESTPLLNLPTVDVTYIEQEHGSDDSYVIIDYQKFERSGIMADFYTKFLAANIPMKVFKAEQGFPDILANFDVCITAKSVYLDCKTAAEIAQWLDHLVPGVQNLFINCYDYDEHVPSLKKNEAVLNAKKLHLRTKNFDEQVLMFKATSLQLHCWNCPTNKVIQLIKKWVDEDYPVDSQLFVEGYIDNWREETTEECLKRVGLQYSKRKRPIDNQVVYKIQMKSGKYMKMSSGWDGSNSMSALIARVCQAPTSVVSSTTNWNDMSDKIKGMIVERMDIVTRTRLKLCSTSDKKLVESTPIRLYEIETGDNYFTIDDQLFFQTNDDTADPYLDFGIKEPFADFVTIRRRILFDSKDEATDQLNNIINSFVANKNVTVDYAVFFNFEIMPEMKMNKIFVMCTKFTDFEMFLIKSKHLRVCVESDKITQSGVNRLLKKMFNDDCPIGNTISIEDVPWVVSIDVLCEGLDVSKVDDKYLIDINSNKVIELGLVSEKRQKTTIKGVVKQYPD